MAPSLLPDSVLRRFRFRSLGLLPPLDKEIESFDVAEFNLSYFNVVTMSQDKISCIATMKRPSTTPEGQIRDFFLDRQRNRITAAQVMEEARKVADEGTIENSSKC